MTEIHGKSVGRMSIIKKVNGMTWNENDLEKELDFEDATIAKHMRAVLVILKKRYRLKDFEGRRGKAFLLRARLLEQVFNELVRRDYEANRKVLDLTFNPLTHYEKWIRIYKNFKEGIEAERCIRHNFKELYKK